MAGKVGIRVAAKITNFNISSLPLNIFFFRGREQIPVIILPYCGL